MDPINSVGVNNYQVEMPKKEEVMEYDNNYQTIPPMYDYTEEKEKSSGIGTGMMALATLGIAGLSLYGGRVWGKNAAKNEALAEGKKFFENSKEEAAKLMSDATAESKKILDEATTKAQQCIDNAKEKAQTMIDEANDKVAKATKRMTDIENRQNKALELANEKTGFWGKLFGIQKLKNKFKAILTPEVENATNNGKSTTDKTVDKVKDGIKDVVKEAKDIAEAGTARTYNM